MDANGQPVNPGSPRWIGDECDAVGSLLLGSTPNKSRFGATPMTVNRHTRHLTILHPEPVVDWISIRPVPFRHRLVDDGNRRARPPLGVSEVAATHHMYTQTFDESVA